MCQAPINVFAFTEVGILSNLYICLACRIRYSVWIVLGGCSGQTVKYSSPFPLPSTAIFGLRERHTFGEEDNLQENLTPQSCFHKNVVICTTWNNSSREDREETIPKCFCLWKWLNKMLCFPFPFHKI